MFSVLKQKVIFPKVELIRHDEHVLPGLGQLLSQEVAPLDPLLQLLQAVSVVTAHTVGTAAFDSENQKHHTKCFLFSSRII